MQQSEYKARQVRAKTNEVFEYDHNDEQPGKPLHILIPGGLIALATLALIILVIYQTWFENSLAENTGITLLILLTPFYIGGVFLFSYGYELYNIPRALRLTAIIVFITLAAVVIVAVLFLLLSNSKGDSKSSSSSSKRSRSLNRDSSSNSSGGFLGMGNVFLGGNSTRVETREVTRDVVREVAKEPMPITCPFCTRSYIPVEYKFTCPSCGAATPKELIEESQEPKSI